MRSVLLVIAALALMGCAATVEKGVSSGSLAIPQGSEQVLAVSFAGNSKVTANPEWPKLQQIWRNALRAEASLAGKRMTSGPSSGGLVIAIEVSNFRYVTTAERMNLGVMVGNAWVNSKVRFIDSATGVDLGFREYDTSSSAWEGVMSAMTEDQVRAISKEIIADISAAHLVAPVSVPTPTTESAPKGLSKQQRIQQLMDDRSLGYEEYMRRKREIEAE